MSRPTLSPGSTRLWSSCWVDVAEWSLLALERTDSGTSSSSPPSSESSTSGQTTYAWCPASQASRRPAYARSMLSGGMTLVVTPAPGTGL